MFDAGAIEASLTVRTDQFNRDMDAAEARVKEFEKNRHEVKIAAVFDQSSFSRARSAFAQLDNQISKDAMSRLRSSPQGSILGALNALFSPHPVTGAPSAQQAATQGLLGKMISAPGGGGPSPAGTRGSGSVVRDVITQAAQAASPAAPAVKQAMTGQAPGDVTTTDTVKRVLAGNAPGDVTTTDTIKQQVEGKGPGDVTTTDTVKEKLDPASAAKTEKDARDSGDRSGGNWFTAFTGHLVDLLPPSATGKAEKSARDSGNRSGTGFFAGMSAHLGPFFAGFVKSSEKAGSDSGSALDKGLVGGIGPGILGISAKLSTITGLVGSALGALPALAGVAGTGMGVALVGGITEIVSKSVISAVQPALQAYQALQNAAPGKAQVAALKAYQNALDQLTPAQQGLARSLEGLQGTWQKFVQSNTSGVAQMLSGGIGLLPGILNSVSGVFQQVVPQMGSVFKSLGGLVQGLIGVAQTAVPAFAPFVNAVLGLVTNILPGIDVVIKATLPYVSQFAGILGTLGKDLGSLFSSAAPAIGASMQILSGLLGLLGDLLPAVMKIANIFATALAPVFTAFTGVIRTLVPPLVQLAGVIASFAGAVIGDLAAAFTAIARLIAALAPSLTILAGTLGNVFSVMENAGVFAVFGNALEQLVVPIANVVNALVTGLAPALPTLIGAASQLATAFAAGLAAALGAVLTALVPVVSALAQAVTAVTGFLQATGLLMPVMAALVLSVGPVASGLKAMAAAAGLFAEAGMAGALGGMIGTLKEFRLATEGITLAEKAQYAEMLLMDSITPFGWAAIAGVTIGALVIGLSRLQDGIGATVSALAKQDNATGYNIAGYQKLAEQTRALGEQQAKTAEGIGASAAKGAGVVRGVVAGNAAAYSAVSAQTAALAANMASRLDALSGSFGVSKTQIEQWAAAAGISAQKFGGAGENVGLLTKQIGAFVDKNSLAITSTANLSTNIAIFGGDVFSATTQLDAFNAIWNTLVGNLLTKQVAVTQGQQAFDSLKQSIDQSGVSSDMSKQAFQGYIQQIQSSLDALEKGGASVSDLNGYLQTQIDNLSSLHGLSPGEQQDLANLKSFQDALANSTHGLTDAQQTLITQFESSLIPDLQKIGADTPAVTTDISNLANSIIQTGNNSASTAADRAQLIKDLEAVHVSAQDAKTFVDNLQTSIDNLKGKVVAVGVTGTGSGTITITGVVNSGSKQEADINGRLLFSAAGGLVAGGTPGKDSVLAMLMPGEVVVPTAMVRSGAVDHLRGRLPGFAAGGMIPDLSQMTAFAAGNESAWGGNAESTWASAAVAALRSAVSDAVAKAAAAVPNVATAGSAGGIIATMMKNMAAARGWTGAEWNALYALEMAEAGFVMTATNPSSGAYGLAQFINGPSEYASYGGDSTTATGQITGMLNYISCMPLDAAILTRTGWKSYAEVQVGDETVGFDPQTGEARWTVITAVHHYDTAPVRRMHNGRVDLRSTPNHRWIAEKRIQTGTSKPDYYRQEMVRTDQVGTRHRIRLAARLTQDETLPLTSVEAELLGWIAGDGSVYRRDMHGKGGPSAEVRVMQSEAKPEHLRRLRALLSRMPHSEYTQGRNHWSANRVHSFRLSAPYAHDLLTRSGYEDSLELMVLRMSAPQREAFLLGLLMADGHQYYGDDGWVLAQNEGPVLDAAVLAATLLGNFCNITNSAGQKHVVVTAGPFVKGGLDARHQEECGEQPVWCVTTDLGTWTARQDNQVFLTGNSRYGDPIAAEAHEQQFHWYDRGGYLKPGYTMAYNGTSRPELVTPNGAGGATFDDVVARLDKLIRATEQVPAGVGAHVGGALNGAAADASFRSRYPRGGGLWVRTF